jgi:hypothetical protein
MSLATRTSPRPFIRSPLATPAEIAAEPAAFPVQTGATPCESAFADWRRRLVRNLSRRSTARWDPLTYVGAEPRDAP